MYILSERFVSPRFSALSLLNEYVSLTTIRDTFVAMCLSIIMLKSNILKIVSFVSGKCAFFLDRVCECEPSMLTKVYFLTRRIVRE